ncbi:unnamed protein product [Mytilus coruscus]|uniref:Uncharacterized protein n=1 Tax=Mytilus coruscus TaxID=42192 RepID=A0A6J8DND4_MYTCO|nr:unnamed protein product [Mytilus coruscus]
MIGISVLKVEQLNDGEFMLDLDVDGMDASDILSAINGLVDMFSVECLLLSPFGIKYIFVEELFGFEQDGHVQVSSLFPKLLNYVKDIPLQFLRVHLSQSSQAIDSNLHAFWQIVHGNLGCLGPGLGSIPLSRSKIMCCVLLSLAYANILVDTFVYVFYCSLSSNRFEQLELPGY